MKDYPPPLYASQASLRLEFCGKGRSTIKADLTADWNQILALLKSLAA